MMWRPKASRTGRYSSTRDSLSWSNNIWMTKSKTAIWVVQREILVSQTWTNPYQCQKVRFTLWNHYLEKLQKFRRHRTDRTKTKLKLSTLANMSKMSRTHWRRQGNQKLIRRAQNTAVARLRKVKGKIIAVSWKRQRSKKSLNFKRKTLQAKVVPPATTTWHSSTHQTRSIQRCLPQETRQQNNRLPLKTYKTAMVSHRQQYKMNRSISKSSTALTRIKLYQIVE